MMPHPGEKNSDLQSNDRVSNVKIPLQSDADVKLVVLARLLAKYNSWILVVKYNVMRLIEGKKSSEYKS